MQCCFGLWWCLGSLYSRDREIDREYTCADCTMKILRPRTFVELRVGRHQSVEVVIHVRRRDIPWFNEEEDPTHFLQLLSILQTSILPRMFADEIEENCYARLQKQDSSFVRPPKSLGLGGRVQEDPKSMPNAPPRKRGKGLFSKARQAEIKRLQLEALRMEKKNEKDVYYATHPSMTVTYRLEVLPQPNATLLFDDDESNHLLALKKLQRRILLWCYPPPCDAEPEDTAEEGFHRPELIPLSTYL